MRALVPLMLLLLCSGCSRTDATVTPLTAWGDGTKAPMKAHELEAEYEANELAGGKKFLDVSVRVEGVVHSVEARFTELASSKKFDDGQPDTTSVYHTQGISTDDLAKLAKGQRVTFICMIQKVPETTYGAVFFGLCELVPTP